MYAVVVHTDPALNVRVLGPYRTHARAESVAERVLDAADPEGDGIATVAVQTVQMDGIDDLLAVLNPEPGGSGERQTDADSGVGS